MFKVQCQQILRSMTVRLTTLCVAFDTYHCFLIRDSLLELSPLEEEYRILILKVAEGSVQSVLDFSTPGIPQRPAVPLQDFELYESFVSQNIIMHIRQHTLLIFYQSDLFFQYFGVIDYQRTIIPSRAAIRISQEVFSLFKPSMIRYEFWGEHFRIPDGLSQGRVWSGSHG